MLRKSIALVAAVIVALSSNSVSVFAATMDCAKEKTIDVVFVVDPYTVMGQNANDDEWQNGDILGENIAQLAQSSLERDDINLNLAAVAYGKGSVEIFGLTGAEEMLSEGFLDDAGDRVGDWIGENAYYQSIESGIKTAVAILDSSTTGSRVEDRHIILVTDGASVAFENAAGEIASMIYNLGGNTFMGMSNMDVDGDVGSSTRATETMNNLTETNGDYAAAFEMLMSKGEDIDRIANGAFRYISYMNDADVAAEIRAKADAGDLVIYSSSAQVEDLTQYPFANMEIGNYRAAKRLKNASDVGYGIHTIGYRYVFDGDYHPRYQQLGEFSKAFLSWAVDYSDGIMMDEKELQGDDVAAYFAELTSAMYGEVEQCEEAEEESEPEVIENDEVENPATFDNLGVKIMLISGSIAMLGFVIDKNRK